MSTTLTIQHIGPIEDVTLPIRRLTILIGEQGAGKSTIAKVLSFCLWVEKECSMSQSFDAFAVPGYFVTSLERFHKMKGYLREDSFIRYTSDTLAFTYERERFEAEWRLGRWDYLRRKTLYLPAERNMISVVENWFDINLPDNSTRSMLREWEYARKHYPRQDFVSILDRAEYYYGQSDGEDYLLSSDAQVRMKEASSGFQSLVPLVVLLQFYGYDYYVKYFSDYISILQTQRSVDAFRRSYAEVVGRELTDKENKLIQVFRESGIPPSPLGESYAHTLVDNERTREAMKLAHNLMVPHDTTFVIEEPELSLYPSAQADLLRYIVRVVLSPDFGHSVLMTTHSPYMLAALSTLITASEVGQIAPSETERIEPKVNWVKYESVGVWKLFSISDTGEEVRDLMDPSLRMVETEAIDDASDEEMAKIEALLDLKYESV